MELEPWVHSIVAWRTIPCATQARTRWVRIPRNVAESMTFEREEVPLSILDEWHTKPDGLFTASRGSPLQAPADRASAIARQAVMVERQIEQAQFDVRPLDDDLIRDLHTAICEPVAPSLAGWRRITVTVGSHVAPAWPLVPGLMRDYGRDLEVRIAAHGLEPSERLIETLAFAEGRLLSIHPFADYNGRVTRVFLRLLLRRLQLPPVRLAPDGNERAEYLAALNPADRSDWSAMMRMWMARIANATDDF